MIKNVYTWGCKHTEVKSSEFQQPSTSGVGVFLLYFYYISHFNFHFNSTSKEALRSCHSKLLVRVGRIVTQVLADCKKHLGTTHQVIVFFYGFFSKNELLLIEGHPCPTSI